MYNVTSGIGEEPGNRQPSMARFLAVLGCCLVSLNFRCESCEATLLTFSVLMQADPVLQLVTELYKIIDLGLEGSRS